MNIFFTSDHHFHHANILTFTGQDNVTLIRPGFSSVEEMDEVMVERWNKVVRPSDRVYHLGDVTMGRSGREARGFVEWMKRLNGTKRLILGNHDHFPMRVYTEAGFSKIKGVYSVERFVLSHVPLHPSHLGKCVANIHGHIHERRVMRAHLVYNHVLVVDPRYINVCVEVTNYTPVALEDIQQKLRKVA